MGLCKCPKKKFTNQFCFEHRVNVCEYCMLDIHSKCIVQQYFNWLQNSEYQSQCTICGQELNAGECIRLYCYDVFHWSCFNQLQKTITSNGSQNVHVCPKCKTSIFPPEEASSPIAIAVRKRFEQCGWARKSLNLPTVAIGDDDSRTDSFQSGCESIMAGKDDNSLRMLDESRKKSLKSSFATSKSLLMSPSTVPSSSFPSSSAIAFNSCLFGSTYTTSNRCDDKYKKKFPLRNTILLHFFQMLFYRIKRNPKLLILCLMIFLLFVYLVNHSTTISDTDDSNDFLVHHSDS